MELGLSNARRHEVSKLLNKFCIISINISKFVIFFPPLDIFPPYFPNLIITGLISVGYHDQGRWNVKKLGRDKPLYNMPLVGIGLTYLPKIGSDQSPRPHISLRSWL